MKKIPELETLHRAAGVVQGLRGYAALRQSLPTTAATAEMVSEFQGLVDRALLVTEDTKWGELMSIWEDFLAWTAKFQLQSSNGKVN